MYGYGEATGEMKGRTILVSLSAAFAVLLVVSIVFASGFVNVSRVSLFSGPPGGLLDSTANVFVDPDKIIKDYVADPGYQIGNTFVVHVNITGVADLFSYQVNVTWNTAILNFTGIYEYGEFLDRTGSIHGTSRIEEICPASNETGYALIAETILGEYPGITGDGRLVTLEFEIVGYGCTYINISIGGAFPTMLLESTVGASIPFTTAGGYFRNKVIGDADADGTVNVFDILKVKYHWFPGPPAGAGGYERNVDCDDDGSINVFDILIVKANWGRSI